MPSIPSIGTRRGIRQPQRNMTNSRFKGTSLAQMAQACIGLSFFLFIACNLILMRDLLKPMLQEEDSAAVGSNSTAKTPPAATCALRKYPPHRYFGYPMPREEQPSFLTETEYIYGEWPELLEVSRQPVKLCVDQSEWLSQPTSPSAASRLPFADGTNPSLVTLERLGREAPSVAATIREIHSETVHVATACMTNSQCSWQDDAATREHYHLSDRDTPDTVRTVLLLLNDKYETLHQATIVLRLDAPWGRKQKTVSVSQQSHHIAALDDARLFVHGGQLQISYREGPGFGYETQVINPLHLSSATNMEGAAGMTAAIWASETSTTCCGRNMAYLSLPEADSDLHVLTWVDPVTVEVVDSTPWHQKVKGRRLSAAPRKSHIHGTNGFMVPLGDHEYLGVAHYHRPNDRKANAYARFGHHYTHAFYTVRLEGSKAVLSSLSVEFVLPSRTTPGDAELIQFISGLELIENHVLLAYGLNDCESAVTLLSLDTVQRMLRPVQEGQQVIDFMQALQ